MQVNYIKNVEETGRQTKIAMRIAAAGLVLTVTGLAISSYFSYQSSIDSNESSQKSDAQIKAFQIEIRDLAAAQHEERSALLKAITDGQRAFSGTVKK
jgi:cytochrome c biogenesis factor